MFLYHYFEIQKVYNRILLIKNMKKLHWSIFAIIFICIIMIGGLAILNMVYNKEIPAGITTTLSSIIFALIGYGVGKNE